MAPRFQAVPRARQDQAHRAATEARERAYIHGAWSAARAVVAVGQPISAAIQTAARVATEATQAAAVVVVVHPRTDRTLGPAETEPTVWWS